MTDVPRPIISPSLLDWALSVTVDIFLFVLLLLGPSSLRHSGDAEDMATWCKLSKKCKCSLGATRGKWAMVSAARPLYKSFSYCGFFSDSELWSISDVWNTEREAQRSFLIMKLRGGGGAFSMILFRSGVPISIPYFAFPNWGVVENEEMLHNQKGISYFM